MADVTKRFRWGASVEKILDHFTTPEVDTLRRRCRKLIRDFCDLDLEGEGYRCTRIPFEMFHYGFVLAYAVEDAEWVLEVLAVPALGDPDCQRKRPRRRKDGGARRDAGGGSGTGPKAWLERARDLWRDAGGAGLTLTAFWDDARGACGFARIDRLLCSMRRPHQEVRAAPYIRLFNSFAEQQSQGCRNLVQLVRLKVNTAFAFIGPVSSYAHAIPRADELWDPSLFGVAEPAIG
ncbi:MAG TPA: hypothetical protein VEA80_13900 [Vitreimonas sp.]|uniref:hypothetical protein n=1 Tax=Vitreimonas sp. TaxID=3069702 RepID=UPI002D725F4A|nr:hypothetical protein [Vitreimonas sp.]HYD88562.1 hypothetical protein [Vitreimonas sp.]